MLAFFTVALATLERRHVRYVVYGLWVGGPSTDPIREYLARHYERVNLGAEGVPVSFLFRRRDEASLGPPAPSGREGRGGGSGSGGGHERTASRTASRTACLLPAGEFVPGNAPTV